MASISASSLFKAALILILAVWSTQATVCDVDDNQRIDCGWHGIDQTKCQTNNNCCWKPAQISGKPWCFYNQSIAASLKTVTACEHHDPANVSCNANQQIKIVNVFYGRDSSDASCHIHSPVSCFNPNAKSIVENLCKCNSTCSVDPSGTIWNFDFSCDQLNAQLRVFYVCVPKDSTACPSSSQSSTMTLENTASADTIVPESSFEIPSTSTLAILSNSLVQTPFLSTATSTEPSENTASVSTEFFESMTMVTSTKESTFSPVNEGSTSLMAIESTFASLSSSPTSITHSKESSTLVPINTESKQAITQFSSVSPSITTTLAPERTAGTFSQSSSQSMSLQTTIAPTRASSIVSRTSSSTVQSVSSSSVAKSKSSSYKTASLLRSASTFTAKLTTIAMGTSSSISASRTSSTRVSPSVTKKPDINGGKGKSKLTETQKILIGVGAGVFLLLVILVLYCKCYRAKRYRQHSILNDELAPVPSMYSNISMEDMPKKSIRDIAVKLDDTAGSKDNEALTTGEETYNNDLYDLRR